MSCPNWSTLIDRREQDTEGELLWDRALRHLEECDACQEEAYAAEPTLLFQRLPSIQSSQQEIDEMKQSVNAMRRAQPIVAPAQERRSRRFGSASLMRIAAAVAVLAGSLTLYKALGPEGVKPTSKIAVSEVSVSEAPATSPEGSSPEGSLPEGSLHFEIHVIQASKVDRDAPMMGDEPAPELAAKLRELFDYEDFEVVARGNVESIQGSEVVTPLGRGYKATFKTGELNGNGSVTLRDFEMEKVSLVKGGRAPVQFRYSELELSLENPLTLTVASSDPGRDALVLTITCRLEKNTPKASAAP